MIISSIKSLPLLLKKHGNYFTWSIIKSWRHFKFQLKKSVCVFAIAPLKTEHFKKHKNRDFLKFDNFNDDDHVY